MQDHTPQTQVFIKAFIMAWEKSVDDYEVRRINGEHTLQASLYRYMSDYLAAEQGIYRVFAEAAVKRNDFGKDKFKEDKPVRSVVDILVVYQPTVKEPSIVVGAIELKFNPRGLARANDVKKDLARLSCIANRNNKNLRSELEMHRVLTEKKEVEKFRILPQKKLIFAAFCKASHSDTEARMSERNFWAKHKPTDGRWEGKSQPLHLGVALAKTKPVLIGQHDCKRQTEITFFGKAFE
nr:hypothetical protein [uncultured Rhodoferax sp.]